MYHNETILQIIDIECWNRAEAELGPSFRKIQMFLQRKKRRENEPK